MSALRQTGLLIVLTLLIAIGGCGKESPAPPPPKTESDTTATRPAPFAAAPAQPSSAAPSTTPTGVNDQAASELANKSGCLACHAVDKKIIGPSYKEIATKYRGQPDAESKLIQKVKGGGKGAWGQMPMPPNAHVKDEDIKTLVDWVLSQK